MAPVHLPFVRGTSLSFLHASHLTRVFVSQPAPGRPPPRKYTSNLPSPFATTWAAYLPLPFTSPSYSPCTLKSGSDAANLVVRSICGGSVRSFLLTSTRAPSFGTSSCADHRMALTIMR